jgi:UDPglucose--hexose-1-phosphate uridylyltransferase
MVQGKKTNEIRKDVIGRKVVITVVRRDRPQDSKSAMRTEKNMPPEKCFFCPGNEHLTPPEIDRVESAPGIWEIRCFSNKFPAFSLESKKAYGRHEVIVETPEHKKSLSELSVENIRDYLLMAKTRMQDAQKNPKFAYTLVFKNEGKSGGASLEHTHTQIVSMDFVPDHIKKMQKKTAKFAKLQKQNKKSIFFENNDFFAFCPKASRFHFEAWIAPKFRVASLVELDNAKLLSLASSLKSVLGALDATNGFPPYNIIYQSAPHGVAVFPFHVQIMPRLSTWAGFELGTEVVMLSELPETTADILRKALQK